GGGGGKAGVGQVPQLHRPTITITNVEGGGGKGEPIGTERRPPDTVAGNSDGAGGSAAVGQVPQLHRPSITAETAGGSGEGVSVGAERQRIHILIMVFGDGGGAGGRGVVGRGPRVERCATPIQAAA